jgi:acyl-CoA synthetase (AMP-forming)/AMP-acid ligase II
VQVDPALASRSPMPRTRRVIPAWRWDVYETAIASEATTFAWPKLDERTASSLCYTSGTAGDPKGRPLFASFGRCSTPTQRRWRTRSRSRRVTSRFPVVPMFHANAWGVPYAAAMVGSKLVLPGPGLDGKEPLRAHRERARHELAWCADGLARAPRAPSQRLARKLDTVEKVDGRRLRVSAEHESKRSRRSTARARHPRVGHDGDQPVGTVIRALAEAP